MDVINFLIAYLKKSIEADALEAAQWAKFWDMVGAYEGIKFKAGSVHNFAEYYFQRFNQRPPSEPVKTLVIYFCIFLGHFYEELNDFIPYDPTIEFLDTFKQNLLSILKVWSKEFTRHVNGQPRT